MTDPEETYDVTSPLHASHRRIREDFARGMREARICVVRILPRALRYCLSKIADHIVCFPSLLSLTRASSGR